MGIHEREFEDSPNPCLKRISDVRNALEHKYVKVTNGWFPERTKGEVDDFAFYVTEGELSTLTLGLMHIVREAIVGEQFFLFICHGSLKLFFILGNQAKCFFVLLTSGGVTVGRFNIAIPEFFQKFHTVPSS